MAEKTSNISIENFSQELRHTPLLASVLLLNPAAGLAHLGYKLSDSEVNQLGAASSEDAEQASILLENNFQISEPQIIQTAANIDLLSSPMLSVNPFTREPDIALKISAEVIQYNLKSFSKKNFAAQKINGFPTGDWWQLQAIGESMSLELSETGISLTVNFQCDISLNLDLESSKFEAGKIKFPLTVEILPAFIVSGNQLYLSIAKGQIGISNFIFPAALAESFCNSLPKIIPFITVCRIPTQFSLPNNEPDAAVFLTGSQIDESGISLSFHINEHFQFETGTLKTDSKKIIKVVAAATSVAPAKTPALVSVSYPSKVLSDLWMGQDHLWNYDNYDFSAETIERSSGHAVLSTICDFFERNPFILQPKGEPASDGKVHYDPLELLDKFYDWYPPLMTLGENRVSGTEELLRAFTNLKLNPEDSSSDTLGDGTDAQKALIDWIVKSRLPVVVLLDLGELTILENLSTGENEAQPRKLAAHWAVVYAVNKTGVKMAGWGNEYFIPWEVFMKAWNCSFLPHPNNYFQIHLSLKT